MTDSEPPKCIVCKSTINEGAKKCLACGSRQDFLRFFDVGNTSLGLLIAAFSVLALGADNFVKFANYFVDDEQADFTMKITSVSPREISIFVDNDGPGKAILTGTAMCDVWPAATEMSLWLPSTEKPGTFFGTRYPRPEEVIGRYVYMYGKGESPIIIESGESRLFRMPYRDVLISDDKSHQAGEVKSVCNLNFSHENGEDDISWQIIDSVDVSFFSLDNKQVIEIVNEKTAKSDDR